MTIKEIKKLMRLKGWSQRRLAAESGVTESCVSHWLRKGTTNGTADRLLRDWLCAAVAERKDAELMGLKR